MALRIVRTLNQLNRTGGDTHLYLAECAVQRFVLSHELIQEDFEGVDPHGDGRLSPVPLLLPHGLLQDVLKESIQVFVADTLTVVHLKRRQKDQRRDTNFKSLL